MELDDAVVEIIAAFTKINTEVPEKTRAALAEMNHLDESVRRQLQEVQKTKIEFMANYEKMTQDQRAKAFNLLQIEMEKIADMCDSKVGIAKTMRDAVHDAHQKFKEQHQKFIENYKPPKRSESEIMTPKKRSEEEEPKPEVSTEKRRGRKKKEPEIKKEEPEEDGENMEDEEEQKMYCWCQLEKQDNMVFCENPTCKYEWFHFTCIGMVTAPKDDWYCTNACRSAVGLSGKRTSAAGTPKRGGLKKRK
uniref:Inhibitor of growth protein n=1 Tax=Caenorhabditis tropicalis TaxID=1561998 RepID=A0A1I7ULV1_9PELO